MKGREEVMTQKITRSSINTEDFVSFDILDVGPEHHLKVE